MNDFLFILWVKCVEYRKLDVTSNNPLIQNQKQEPFIGSYELI